MALSIDPYFSYILNPLPSLEGIRIQEGSLCALLYTLGAPVRASLAWSLLSERPGLPSSALSPLCDLNVNLFSMLLPMGSHR